MAQHTVVSRSRCFPIPDTVDDDIAAEAQAVLLSSTLAARLPR